MAITGWLASLMGGILLALGLLPAAAQAGGVALGTTRIIYPADSKQVSLSVLNTDSKSVFLLQSWLEDAAGNKTQNLLLTPPLVLINPNQENTLRILSTGSALPTDRESLFWVNVKSVPSVDKKQQQNILQLAIVNRIKLFWRPTGLALKPVDAPAQLRFRWLGKQLHISNPTPYYLTLVDMRVGGHKLTNTMVPPLSSTQVESLNAVGGEIDFSTLNDYGATTATQRGILH
ncbi:fimbria/pilus periplasmic chaperone [Serratia liquefaciens]|uniref:fimbria/pilus periplasmic chaperone n=1 Tax=Serratia liquefaciens TaxID=614 RepID=UPI0022B9CA67|nr:fimbria/pilus periplasmic chaperone [Serratia liquefaciens]